MYFRHGEASHYVRPDRVYRTGVVVPAQGYYPQADAMRVAEAFTAGPYWFHQGAMSQPMPSTAPYVAANPGVSGYGLRGYGLRAPGPFKRAWLRIKAASAARKANQLINVAQGMRGLGFAGPDPGGAIMVGSQAVPANSGRVQVLMQMALSQMPPMVGHATGAAVMNQWENLRWGRP